MKAVQIKFNGEIFTDVVAKDGSVEFIREDNTKLIVSHEEAKDVKFVYAESGKEIPIQFKKF